MIDEKELNVTGNHDPLNPENIKLYRVHRVPNQEETEKVLQEITEKFDKPSFTFPTGLKHYHNFTVSRVEPPYETDENKFKQELDKLINFLKNKVQNEEIAVLFIERIANTIMYGQFEKGFKSEASRFDLMNNDGLKGIYELIKVEFADTYEDGCTHSAVEGWNLLPALNGDVLLHIESQNLSDRNWIYEEATKCFRQKNEERKLTK